MRIALIVAGCLFISSSGVNLCAQPPVERPAQPPPQPAAQPPAQARPPTARPGMTVFVTTLEGKPLAEIRVKATGPVDREGATDADGTVTFRNLSAGTYRLRFEHEAYVTFEREVSVAAGRSTKATAALNAAPPPPAPPPAKPEPVPAPGPSAPAGPPAQPTTMSIIDYIEKNYIKNNAPWMKSVVGCMPTATAHVLQLRNPVTDHAHGDGDEMLYVIAGTGSHRMLGTETPLTAGVFVVVPRGTSHSIARQGSNPLMLLTILAGPPCTGT